MPSPLQTAEIPDADDGAFTVSSSLPPMVTGALAGEMELSVPCFFAKPGTLRPSRYLRERQHGRSPLCAVRIQWWGDVGPGTVLKPDLSDMLDEKGQRARSAGLSSATCALFPVRCGLEGLVAYLKDMVSFRRCSSLSDWIATDFPHRQVVHVLVHFSIYAPRACLWAVLSRSCKL